MLIRAYTAVTTLIIFVLASMSTAQEQKITVRQLTNPRSLPITLGGGKQVQKITSADSLAKLVGAKAAAELASQVDFAKEDVLFVSWGTSGPPFGMLQFAVSDNMVEFFIREPAVKQRGEAFRIGADFFAATKGVTARFRGAKK